jgi:hypothetical protein
VQRVIDDRIDRDLIDHRLAAASRRDHAHTVETFGTETTAPTPDRVRRRLAPPRDLLIRHAISRQQQRLGLHHHPMRQRTRTREHLEIRTLTLRHLQRGCDHHRHTRSLTRLAISATDH